MGRMTGKMKKARLPVLAVALLLVLSSLVACAAPSPSASTAPSEAAPAATPSVEASASGDVTQPATKGDPVPLTIGLAQDTNIVDYATNAYTKNLEAGANVKLSFELYPGKEASQKLSVLISSNSKLPDVINMNLTSIEVYTYGSQGAFIPLNEYFDKLSNYSKAVDPKYVKYYTSADGNIYGMPRIVEEVGNDWSSRMWINKTWLEKLGLSMPKTTDEYYNALKAFKTQDPNGNGKADEIPLIGSNNGWNSTIWPTLMNAFIYSNKDFHYITAGDDGKLDIAINKPEWKQGLEYMNKLCAEGLLSPETWTQDNNQLKTIIENADAQIVGSLMLGSMSIYQVESKRKEDMTHLPPLTGPNGVCWSTLNAAAVPALNGFITKDCKTPEAAFQMFDYMYNPDMVMQGRFGVKDTDWKEPTPGQGVGLYEKLGYKPVLEYIKQIWGTQQNSHWSEVHPTNRTYAISGGQLWNNNPYDSQYMTSLAVPDYMGKAPKNTVLTLIFTPEEVDQIADIQTAIDTYRDQMTVGFITGSKPLTDWDAYVAELDKMGLQTYLKVCQQAYDRMQSAK